MSADKPRWQQLREQRDVATADLDQLWTRLRPARAEDILGQWRGDAFQTGHPLCGALPASGWYGKNFLALDDAQPLICRRDDGTLFSNIELGQGEATLWNIEFRGEVTATMVYDGRAVFDHFKWLDDCTLMGITNGRPDLVLAHGEYFYFLLERVAS
ncbi:DUF4334 domain-containing protein [Nocardia sp. NPDC058666]|uniref:DUF4334 domain-containing protein n=1 Tax=Nocardia sp. NPDC058666 TaxID=3346587 RepID=UPI0036553DA3